LIPIEEKIRNALQKMKNLSKALSFTVRHICIPHNSNAKPKAAKEPVSPSLPV